MRNSQNLISSKTEDQSKLGSERREMKNNKSKKQVIAELVKQWHNNFQIQKKQYTQCFSTFIQQLSKSYGMKIIFDNSISNTLAELSKEIQFFQFNNQKQNLLKKTLEFINDVLKEKSFISERQYNKFKNAFLSSNMEDSIYLLQQNLRSQGYVKGKFQTETLKKVDKDMSSQDKTILINLWNITMMVDLLTFWQFILKQKIQHRQFLIIFKTYEAVIIDKSSKDFVKQIKRYLRDWIERKRLQKEGPMRNLQTSIVEYDHFLNLKAESISVYLDKERWELYTKQYEFITDFLIKRCNTDKIRFQPYGSFKSKFYVLKYSDIDIGLYYNSDSLNNRDKLCNVLVKVNDAINADKGLIPNCLYSKVFIEDKIKIPFVKIIYRNQYGANKDIVPTMDIIINNYEGIQNSNMLALYSEDQYILKFCNVIKYWAVNRNLINTYKKIQGLSSYGVLLMCLYYLMVSKQIPYLKKQHKIYDIGKKEFNIKNNILDNFIGFLKFYSYEYTDYQTQNIMRGQFHIQKKIVCLLQDHEGKKVYEEDIIINMYDFIDGTNPGRMKTYLYDKFKSIFNETLQCLQQRSISFLEIVYSDDQSKKAATDNRIVQRGNRFST